MKVLVIGLDGSCMDLIKPWANEGKLPTFKKLLSEGSYGYLESVTPPITVPAWNCLATGKNPGKIGCFGFIQKSPNSYDFRMLIPSARKERDVWDILSDFEKKVFILNAPNVISAYKVNGYMVSGFMCPSKEKKAYPRSLVDVLSDLNYDMELGDLLSYLAISDSDLSKMLKDITEQNWRALTYLLEKDWDFGFFVLQELDGIQHKLWTQKDVILKHYQNIDRKLSELMDRLKKENDEANIIIVSDHGFGPNNKMFLINEWLANRGFLEVKKTMAFELVNGLIRTLKGPNILKILKLLMKFPLLMPIYNRLFLRAVATPIIWDKTKAFSYGNWGGIFINLEGREPKGVVRKEDYEKLRTKIIDGLKKEQIKAYRREDLYHGEYLEYAPDIIIQTNGYIDSISGKVGYNKEFMEGFPLEGYHNRMNGTFIACGPDIKENSEMGAMLYDIAPTILHMFGIPIPKDMDGRVLKEIFKGDLATKDINYQKIDEKKKIKDKITKLRNTGVI